MYYAKVKCTMLLSKNSLLCIFTVLCIQNICRHMNLVYILSSFFIIWELRQTKLT